MVSQKTSKIFRYSWFTVMSAGMLFASSCGVAEIRAISAGITAATSSLDSRNDNISFADWLSDELRDL